MSHEDGSGLARRWGRHSRTPGSFAIVFRFDADGTSHAVRCFTRPQAELLHRYHCIEEHLSRVDLPYFSRFELIPEGILVKDAWRPVLVMDWAPGDKFDAYIGSHRENPTALRKLAGDVVTMARELEASGIAHGDLQHGNIFVGPDGIRLVDYDGMFVPLPAGEGGDGGRTAGLSTPSPEPQPLQCQAGPILRSRHLHRVDGHRSRPGTGGRHRGRSPVHAA